MQTRAFFHFVQVRHIGEPAESAFDPDCFDFGSFLGRRLGVTNGLASELLGQWLRSYEPVDQLAENAASLA
jgi:hypothetical protein